MLCYQLHTIFQRRFPNVYECTRQLTGFYQLGEAGEKPPPQMLSFPPKRHHLPMLFMLNELCKSLIMLVWLNGLLLVWLNGLLLVWLNGLLLVWLNGLLLVWLNGLLLVWLSGLLLVWLNGLLLVWLNGLLLVWLNGLCC